MSETKLIEDSQKLIAYAGLLLTFLQTIVAVIALSKDRSQNIDPAVRQVSIGIIKKALVFFFYSSVVVAVIEWFLIGAFGKDVRLDSLWFLLMIPLLAQGMMVAFPLYVAFRKGGRRITIALVYGLVLSAIIATSSHIPNRPDDRVLYMIALVLGSYGGILVCLVFVVFFSLARKAFSELETLL